MQASNHCQFQELSCTSFVAPLSDVIFLVILILSDACSNSEDVECLMFLLVLILCDAWSNSEDVECLMFLVILILSDACSNSECLMFAGHTSNYKHSSASQHTSDSKRCTE